VLGVEESGNSLGDYEERTYNEQSRGDEGAEQGESAIPIRVVPVASFHGQALEEPGRPEGETVSQVVDCIGHDGKAVRPQTSKDLEYGEDEI